MTYSFEDMNKFVKNSRKIRSNLLEKLAHGKDWTVESFAVRSNSREDLAEVVHKLADDLSTALKWIETVHGENFAVVKELAEERKVNGKKAIEAVNSLQTAIDEKIVEPTVKLLEEKEVKNNAGLDWSTIDFKKTVDLPMKQAIKEIEKDEERGKNLVFHGLDIDPEVSQEKQGEKIKKCARNCVREIMPASGGGANFDIVDMRILGKLGKSGKAPPVLMKMKCSNEAQYLIRNSYRLSRVTGLRRVFVTPDLSKEAREDRKKTLEDLKRKITNFPEQRWVIKGDTVTSVGKFAPSVTSKDNKLDRSFNY